MSEQEMIVLLVKRFSGVQNPMGRWRLNIYTFWKRTSWKWLIVSTSFIKRFCDIIASLLFLVLFSPLFLILALAIKLEDRGPVLFVQRRVGKFGKTFRMYKFRSMCVEAEEKLKNIADRNHHAAGVTFKMKGDPRITRVGRFLRKFSLDELPQFVNVLQGDMSLVGPRPPLPSEVVRYSNADRRRLSVAPGLTCFWQIGGRAEIDFPEQVQLDIRYIESQSFWVDIKILLKTVPAVLFGRGAC